MLDVPAVLSALFGLFVVLAALIYVSRISYDARKIRELLERAEKERRGPAEP
jgi:hypothetical protein